MCLWDTMPIGSYVAEEVTPPNGYSLSKGRWQKSVRNSVGTAKRTYLSFLENDTKVKIQSSSLNDATTPLPGAVFHILGFRAS